MMVDTGVVGDGGESIARPSPADRHQTVLALVSLALLYGTCHMAISLTVI
jgi:hypothetical protein